MSSLRQGKNALELELAIKIVEIYVEQLIESVLEKQPFMLYKLTQALEYLLVEKILEE